MLLIRWRNKLVNLRRYFGVVGIALGAFIAAIGVWIYVANIDPDATVPNPALPVPNAYDDYVAATKRVVHFQDAVPAVRFKNDLHRTATTAQKAQYVRANAPALALVRRGFAHEYREPPIRSFKALFPYMPRYRELARVLRAEGQVKAAHGDYSGAMDSYLDAVYFGGETPKGSILIGRLVGIAMQSIGRHSAWDAVAHLDAAAARRAARRMEAIGAREFPYAETLREDMWAMQGSLLELFRNNDHLRLTSYDAEDKPFGCSADPEEDRRIALLFHLYGKRRTYENYTAYMEGLIEQARLPYAAHAPDPPVPPDPLNGYLCSGLAHLRFRDVGNQAQNSLLTVALALQAYRAEHGRYPAALSELAPQYVQSIPDDPFALTGPLRYRPNGAGYVLYSIGPDGKDDGGKAIEDSTKAGNLPARFDYQSNSIGDIVAGVNRR